jgi:predicted N-acetyltransferase YhbS
VTKFKIVDGVASGYGHAGVEFLFEIALSDMQIPKSKNEYIDVSEYMEEALDQALRKAKRYLSDSLKEVGYYGKDEVSIIETNSIDIGEINLSEVEIEEV